MCVIFREMPISRREFLRCAAGFAGAALPYPRLLAQPRFDRNPYSLGVASGYPDEHGVVLWTRLAPEPLAGGGMPPAAVEVGWEVAADETFRSIVRRGTETAAPEWAHSVRAEVAGLEPGRWYFYRFHAGAATSPVGRTRTTPQPGPVERMRLAFAACQQYEQGWYAAYRHMAQEDLDLVVHLGDYIYESSWGRVHVRKHGTEEPWTLADYRNRYALYKSDRDLQAADIPEVKFPGGLVRIIAGAYGSAAGPIGGGSTDPLYLDVQLEAGATFSHPIKDGYNAFAYPYEGELEVGNDVLHSHAAGVLSVKGEFHAKATKATRFILLAAKPIGEPVVQYGPFVMNTRQEIEQAIRDYQDGTLAAPARAT